MHSNSYSEIFFSRNENKFYLTEVEGQYRTKGPLSVGLQITRRCNLRCIYCSEPYNIRKDPNVSDIAHAIEDLASVDTRLIKLTGGEPLIRKDFFAIVDLIKRSNIIAAVDTNATLVSKEVAKHLSETMLYVETTVDGKPRHHNNVRGHYDAVLSGIGNLSDHGVPILFSTVAVGECLEDIKHVISLAQQFNVKTVKILTPIPKGRGNCLPSTFHSSSYLLSIWDDICNFKEKINSNVKVIFLDWMCIGKGSVILVQPDGLVVGSPSLGEEGCITPLGNIFNQSMEKMWADYPYKENHLLKCTEKTILGHGIYSP